MALNKNQHSRAQRLAKRRTKKLRHHQRRPQIETLERRDLFALASFPTDLFETATVPVAVQLGLLDDDGRYDMAILEANGDLSVALNNGDDTWQQVKTSSLAVTSASGLAFGLINDDAYLDAIIQGANEVVIAFGDGAGTFSRAQSLTPAASGMFTTSGFSNITPLPALINDDTFTDLVVAIPGTDQVAIYLGQAGGTFGSPTLLASGGDRPIRLAAADFLGDASPDLAIAHGDGTLTFLEGDAAGGFVLRTNSTVAGLGTVTGLATGDFNEDGQADLVASSTSDVRVLVNPTDPLPLSPLANGDFSLGLTGWTATAGSVSAVSGIAQLRESSTELLSTLERSFIVPAGATTLTFDLVALGLELPTNGLADAFEVSLLNAADQSLVPTFRTEATSFLNAGPDGTIALASGVTRVGTRVSLDLSGLTPGTVARLVFDLVGNPVGAGSTVLIDNVTIDPATAWGTTFTSTSLPGSFTATAGLAVADVDQDGHLDILVTDNVDEQLIVAHGDGTLTFTRWTYDTSGFGTGATALAVAPLTTGDAFPDVSLVIPGATAVLSPLAYEPVVSSEIFRVPGAPGEVTELVFNWEERNAGYNNELGFFIVDDNQGRVNSLLPGATGYIEAALASAGRQVVFASNQTQGAVTRVLLPAGTRITPYLIQNNTTGQLLRNNPTGSVSGSPLVWFLHGAANTDGYNHFQVTLLPDGRVRYNVEDQTHNGDGDFDDMVFTVYAEPGEPLPLTRFTIVDDTSLAHFRYSQDGLPAQQTGLGPTNTRPRDITTVAAGDKYWVIDANKKIYVYSASGDLLGAWQPTGLNTPTGIATDGTDIWVIDSGNDRVHRYTGAATRLTGSQAASSTFNLNSNNGTASGITTDGSKLWVSDEGSDRVFVYTFQGQLLGSWQLDAANSDASGLTVSPSGGDDLWVVDRQDQKVYHYAGGELWTSGQHNASGSFSLAAANRKPEGIADPPTPISLDTTVNGTISVANQVNEYTFTVTAGQLIYFDQLSLTGVSSTTMSMKLFDPASNQVSGFGPVFADKDTFELTSSGTYTLQIKGTQAGASYSFKIVDVPATTTDSLTLDVNESGTLAQGETRDFTFTVAAGQLIYLDAITPTSISSGVYWQLRSPSDTVIVSNRAFRDVDTLELAAAGTYTLRVYSTVASQAYEFKVVDVPATSSTAINLDTVINAQITKMGETDEFTFEGAIGQQLYLYSISPISVFSGVEWSLHSPTGVVAVSTRGFAGDVDTFTLSESGTYTLRIHGELAATDYSFQVVDVPPVATVPIDLDTTYADSISIAGASNRYTFEGVAGQRLYFELTATGNVTRWKLTGPSGVAFNFTTGNREETLAATGLYTLEVDATEANTPSYTFKVFAIPNAVTTSIAFGDSINGTLTVPGEFHRYSFTASAGQQALFDTQLGNNTRFSWRLYSPTSTLVFPSDQWVDRGPLTLVAGTYILEVDGRNASIGDYRFSVIDVAPAVVHALELGEVVNDTVASPGEVHQYRFTAAAGQLLYLETHAGGSSSFQVKLEGPSGSIWTQATFVDRDAFAILETGEYILSVYGNGAATGAFSFTLHDVPPTLAQTIAIGQTVQGTIAVPGEEDRYQFAGTAGDRLYFDVLENQGLYKRGFELRRSNGTSVFVSPVISSEDRALFTLPADDTYTIVVGQLSLTNTTGDYRFRLLSVPEDLTLPAAWNTDYTDAIVPGQTLRYTFSATAGQGLLLDILANSGTAPFTLLGPSSQVVVASTSSDQWIDSLPATGTYTLVIGDSDNDLAGPVKFRLQDNATPVLGSPDTMGTDFWVAFPSMGRDIDSAAETSEQTLYITSHVNTSGTVSIPGMNWYSSFSVTAGQTTRIALPAGTEISGSSAEVTVERGVRITALAEVAVHATSYLPALSDGFQALPVDALGLEYVAVTYKNTGVGFSQYLNSSHFVVVATVDNTVVTITPSDDAGARTAGVAYTVTLDAGETYQLTHQQNPGDLTGSLISADHPIAVFSGNAAAIVPASTPTSNMLVEQLAPVVTWGREFVTTPLATRQNGDLFRILAGHDNTSVTINGAIVATLDKGDFYETTLTSAAHIEADHGILVAQFSHSTNFDFVLNADPFLLIVPPVEQFATQHVLTTPTVGYLAHYVNIVVPTAAKDTVQLDGALLAGANFTALGATGYSTAQILVAPGRHEIASPAPLGVTMYGFGVQDGYGYTGSMHLAPLHEVSTLSLTPLTANVPLNSQHLVVATVRDASNNPLAGVRVDFLVSGSASQSGSAITNALGQAQFSATGIIATTDTITARVGELATNATVTWSDSAPVITVESPSPDSELIIDDGYLLTGLALPGTPLGSIVDVKVNGLSVEALDAKGRFFIRVPIVLGTNTFSITATRADGVTATVSVDFEGVAAPTGGIDLETMTDVTSAAVLVSRSTFFNRQTRQLHSEVLLRNASDQPLTGPVVALVDRIVPASVSIPSSPDGTATDGRLQVIFDTEFGAGSLGAGVSTNSGVWLTFDDPTRARFTLDTTILAYANHAPAIQSVPQLEAVPEVDYAYRVVATDLDADELTFALAVAPQGMTIDATGKITWEPLTTQAGTHDVEVLVNDQRGGATRQKFSLNVRLSPTNRAPIFTTAPVTETAVSSNYLYEPAAWDLEGDSLVWSLSQKPTGMAIDTNTGEITWTGATSGNHPITVRVDDGQGGVSFQSFVLSVGTPSSNLGAPILRGTPPTEGTVGILYAWQTWADDPDGGTLSYSLSQKPTGMAVDANGRITWTPQVGQEGPNTVELVVDDNAGGVTSLIFSIEVANPAANTAPVFTSSPVRIGTAGATYAYNFAARDAEGDAITYELVSGHSSMTFDSANRMLTWTPTAVGEQLVRLRAYDANGGVNWQTYLIDVRPVNAAPEFTTTPVTAATAGVVYRYHAAAFDADDDVIYSFADAPEGMSIDPQSGLIWWAPVTGDLGPHTIHLLATDERGAATSQEFTLTVGSDTAAPHVTLVRSAESANFLSPIDLQVFANDNLGVSSYALTVNGAPLALDSQQAATFIPVAAGIYTIVATATDAANNTGSTTFRLRVVDPADTTAPTITLTSPSTNATVSYLTDLLGTINDTNLDYWRVEYARFDTHEFRTLALGTSNVASSLIATFDPTMLQNDQYTVRIVAADISGNTSTLELPLEVFGQAKLGQFRQEFTDLTIPLAGIPITITRVYDTLQANDSGDFGYGWILAVREAQIRETVRQNPLESQVGLFATNAFRDGTRVYLNAPDGRRIGFTFTPVLEEGGWLGEVYRPHFTADPGVYETLAVPDMPLSRFPDGTYHLYWSGFNYNPSEYTLTTRDALTYTYDQFTGLKSVTDRNNNTLTYTETGITSSAGESIDFVRDAQGRITQIIDPAGNALTYSYNAQGDLVLVTNQENLGTAYSYYSEPAHYLREVTSDCGCTSYLRSEYDESGRIIAVYDANGVPAQMQYDLENNSEVIADREGHETTLVYDDRGNIISVTDPVGNITTSTYDANDNLTTTTNALGYVTTFDYDDHGNVVKMVDAENGEWRFTYNSRNDVSTTLDPLGRSTTYIYNSTGTLVEFINAAGIHSHLGRDAQGRITSVTNNNGYTTAYVYGNGPLPIEIINHDLTSRTLAYNQFGEVTLFTDENGHATSYQFDKSGRPLAFRDEQDNEVVFAYEDELLASTTDPLGRVTRYRYDNNNRPTQVIDALGNVTTLAFDANGRLTATANALGHANASVYDKLGRITATVDALGHTTRYGYDAVGNRTSLTDAEGRTTTFVYDGLGRLTRRTDAYGNYQIFTYDHVGNLTSSTDELGNATKYFYDELNRLIRVNDAANGNTEYGYDNEGHLTSVTDPNEHATTFVYDPRGRLSEKHDAAGKTVRYGYDDAGNMTSFTDELNKTTAFVYDSLNRLVETIDPVTGTTKRAYDNAGNLLTLEDAVGRITSYEYDPLNRVISVTDPQLASTQYEYDAVGNLTAVIDPLTQRTSYRYDATNRLLERIDPLQRTTRFAYDQVGNLTERIDRNGRRITFHFDDLDRLVAERWWEGTSEVNTLTFDYDATGRLVSAADNFSQYGYTYDVLGRVLTVDNGGIGVPHLVLTYAYDAVGNRLSIADNLGVTVTSTYDARNLLASRTWSGPDIAARSEFAYNDRGQRSELERFSDAMGVSRIGRTTYDYDGVGRITDITHHDPLDAVLVDYDYIYDLAGQLTSEAHHGQTTAYTHDDSGQLIAADHSSLSDEAYSYDHNGNRTNTGYQTGPNNQLASDGTYDYTYDAEGNLRTKTEIATGTFVRYSYDHRNRLIKTEERNATGILLKEVTFTYDLFDRRIAKIVDADGAGSQAAFTEHYAYDANHVWADFDDNGDITARYLYSDAIDDLLARYHSGDGVDWYLTDHLGTVRDLIDDSGAVINHIDYDSFGNIVAQTNALEGDRYTYTGREFEGETGLYYYRARYYDAGIGRFISQDPIGFAAGDMNLYRYVKNDAVNLTDPSGMTVAAERSTADRNVSLTLLISPEICIATSMISSFATRHLIFEPAMHSLGVIDAPANDFAYALLEMSDIAQDFAIAVVMCTINPASVHASNAILVVAGAIAVNAAYTATLSSIASVGKHHILAMSTGGQGSSNSGSGNTSSGGSNLSNQSSSIRTGNWGQGSFGSAESSLQYHFGKHGDEVGATNIDQYLRKAEGFSQNLKGARKSPVHGDTPNVTRYKKNGKYIDLDADGNIISFGAE